MKLRDSLRFSYPRKIMLITFLIIVAMSLVLSLAFWQLSSRVFSQMEREQLARSADSVRSQLSAALETVQSLTTQVIRQGGLQALGGADAEALERQAGRVDSLLRSAISTSATASAASMEFLNVYFKNGGAFCSLDPARLPYRSYDGCLDALRGCGVDLGGYVPPCWVDDLTIQSSGGPARCLVGIRFLYDEVTLEKIGVLVIGVKQAGLRRVLSAMASDCFLARADGRVLSSSETREIGASLGPLAPYSAGLVQLADGREGFVYRVSGGTAWLVCPIDESVIRHGAASALYSRQVAAVTAAALVAAMLLSWLGAKGLTRSLMRLKAVVQRVYEGDLSARFQTDQNDEIAYLGRKINDMLEQVEDFFRTQERDAAEKQNLELRLMQAQINPHLLYNTLNSVIWIIRQKDMEKAEELILSLGSFFRLVLSKGNEEVPLSSEISLIQYYLKVQNLGRGKAFTLRDEVPERFRACKVLRLTLQPLAENAVIHGFSDWRDDGQLVLTAEAGGGALLVALTDNGIGILPEELEALTAELETYPPQGERSHYGLYNIHRRIQNKYGRAYGLRLESEVGDYTRMTLRLPLEEERNDDRPDAH